MADLPQKRPRGRTPKGVQIAPAVTFTLLGDHYDYLRYLVEVKRRLGTTVNEAARYILIRELDKMLRARYHKKGAPSE
jgi:hypothetical protein